jgi:hypothetical protein
MDNLNVPGSGVEWLCEGAVGGGEESVIEEFMGRRGRAVVFKVK